MAEQQPGPGTTAGSGGTTCCSSAAAETRLLGLRINPQVRDEQVHLLLPLCMPLMTLPWRLPDIMGGPVLPGSHVRCDLCCDDMMPHARFGCCR
jgi:hypothetical protein